MNISALYNDFLDKSGEQYKHINSFVASGLLYIVGHYFANWSNYFVLTLCCRNNYTCTFYNDMFHKMFSEWKEWPLQIVKVNENDYPEVKEAHQYNIIFTDSYDSFLETEFHTNPAKYNKNEYFFIFLQIHDHLAYGEMQKIFEYCWQHYFINCVVQVQTANGQVLIYTYFPFTEKFCGQVETVLVNQYNGTAMILDDLFPKKLKNFHGCPLRAVLYHVPPYVYLSKDSNNVTYVSGGFEGKLLLELSKKLNFSVDVIVSSNETIQGVILSNSSMTGSLKILQDYQADISFGSTRQTSERMMLLSSTKHYYQTFWGVMALSEAYVLTSLETLIFPFNNDTWYLLAVTFILTLSIVALLKLTLPKYLLKHLDYVTLDILAISLGMSAFTKPVYITTRILKSTWIIFSLILRTFYQALLFHLIRTHIIRNMPQTLKELVNQNYTLVVDKYTHEGLKNIALFKTINFIVMNTTDRASSLAYLENLPVHQAKHMAVVLPMIRFQYYVEMNRKINVFKVLPEYIMHVKLCMYLAKRSFLVEQFNEILRMFKGFGILHSWVNQEIDMHYIKRTNAIANNVLDLNKLKMAFVLLLVGYIMATVVFIGELLYKRTKRFRRLRILVTKKL